MATLFKKFLPFVGSAPYYRYLRLTVPVVDSPGQVRIVTRVESCNSATFDNSDFNCLDTRYVSKDTFRKGECDELALFPAFRMGAFKINEVTNGCKVPAEFPNMKVPDESGEKVPGDDVRRKIISDIKKAGSPEEAWKIFTADVAVKVVCANAEQTDEVQYQAVGSVANRVYNELVKQSTVIGFDELQLREVAYLLAHRLDRAVFEKDVLQLLGDSDAAPELAARAASDLVHDLEVNLNKDMSPVKKEGAICLDWIKYPAFGVILGVSAYFYLSAYFNPDTVLTYNQNELEAIDNAHSWEYHGNLDIDLLRMEAKPWPNTLPCDIAERYARTFNSLQNVVQRGREGHVDASISYRLMRIARDKIFQLIGHAPGFSKEDLLLNTKKRSRKQRGGRRRFSKKASVTGRKKHLKKLSRKR